jgi:hypothetical protein
MKLIPNWKDAWKFLSMRILALAAVWETIPAEAKAAVFSPENQGKVTVALILLAALGRVKDQGITK